MQKAYELHELEYQRMAREGIRSWMERDYASPLDANHARFLEDAQAQPWFPQRGRVLEIGCGTAPFLQWFSQRGYRGMGIDVSKTAIRMARKANTARGITFRHADICRLNPDDFPRFDVVVDGQCLHCLTEDADRARMLAHCRRLLKPHGVLVILTMCSPIDRSGFKRLFPRQRVHKHRIYVPYTPTSPLAEVREFGGATYLATRCIPHVERVVREIRDGGFAVQLQRVSRCNEDEVCSALALCATRNE